MNHLKLYGDELHPEFIPLTSKDLRDQADRVKNVKLSSKQKKVSVYNKVWIMILKLIIIQMIITKSLTNQMNINTLLLIIMGIAILHTHSLRATLTHSDSLQPILTHSEPLQLTPTHSNSLSPTPSHSNPSLSLLLQMSSLYVVNKLNSFSDFASSEPFMLY